MRSEHPYTGTDAEIRAILAGTKTQLLIIKPDCKPGDQLWIKEQWALTGEAAGMRTSEFHHPEEVFRDHLIHRAGCDGYDDATQHWRPATSMPRWATRILLDITHVRKTLLHKIAQADLERYLLHVNVLDWNKFSDSPVQLIDFTRKDARSVVR